MPPSSNFVLQLSPYLQSISSASYACSFINLRIMFQFCSRSNEHVLQTKIPFSFSRLNPFWRSPLCKAYKLFNFFSSKNLCLKSSADHSLTLFIYDVQGFELFNQYCLCCCLLSFFFFFIYSLLQLFELASGINFFMCFMEPSCVHSASIKTLSNNAQSLKVSPSSFLTVILFYNLYFFIKFLITLALLVLISTPTISTFYSESAKYIDLFPGALHNQRTLIFYFVSRQRTGIQLEQSIPQMSPSWQNSLALIFTEGSRAQNYSSI